MKKTIAMLLALMLICTLFASCGGGSTESPSAAPTESAATAAPSASAAASSAPAESAEPTADAVTLNVPEPPHAGDTLAVNADGTLKYELDEKGFPTTWYDYELPLTTDNHTYSYWGTNMFGTQYIPEGGLNAMEYYTFIRDKTGVNLEYIVKTGDEISTSFSLMMAADEYSDIMSNASLYWTTSATTNMINEGYFVNIADYIAYTPNFRYIEPYQNFDPELHNAIWLNSEMILAMGFLIENQLPGTGWVVRGDWLDRLEGAPAANQIRTYAQFEDMLNRFKNEIIPEYDYGPNYTGYPYLPQVTVEALGDHLFGGMNTGMQLNTGAATIAALTRVVPPEESKIFTSNSDRVVTFTYMDEADYDALEFFLKWQDEGLLNPDFETLTETNDFQNEVINNRAGVFTANPSVLDTYISQALDPNMRWEAMVNPSWTGVWDSKFGNAYRPWGYIQGFGWSFSASAPNIPLLVSYGDWFYSDEGCTIGTWGIEDLTYYYTNTGEQLFTDFVTHNDLGLSAGWFILFYSQNPFAEPIRQNHLRSYAFPEGQPQKDMFYIWAETITWLNEPNIDHWNWPSADAKPTIEVQEEITTFLPDAQTYLTENYWGFLNNVTPLNRDTWNTYVKGALDVGYTRYQLIMQKVYEDYMAKR